MNLPLVRHNIRLMQRPGRDTHHHKTRALPETLQLIRRHPELVHFTQRFGTRRHMHTAQRVPIIRHLLRDLPLFLRPNIPRHSVSSIRIRLLKHTPHVRIRPDSTRKLWGHSHQISCHILCGQDNDSSRRAGPREQITNLGRQQGRELVQDDRTHVIVCPGSVLQTPKRG